MDLPEGDEGCVGTAGDGLDESAAVFADVFLSVRGGEAEVELAGTLGGAVDPGDAAGAGAEAVLEPGVAGPVLNLHDGESGFDDRGLWLGRELDFWLAVVLGLAMDAGAAELAAAVFEADAGEEIVDGLDGGGAVWRGFAGLPWHDSHFIGRDGLPGALASGK